MRKLLNVNLRLFEGAGEGAGGEGTAQAAAGEERAVIYGKQPGEEAQAAAGMDGTKEEKKTDPEERRKQFEELIKGDYKDLFAERMQKVIDGRFKETKTLQEQHEAVRPVVEMLMERYGASDVKELERAIEEDTGYYEEEAAERGMTVEQLKEMKKLERENAQLMRERQQSMEEERIKEINQKWLMQAEETKAVYPEFDFEAEKANESFANLICRGVDVKAAYEVTHMGELMGVVAQTTAEKTRQATVNNIRARNARPQENGTSKQPGVTVKKDVNKLTAEDRREIARRVARGEIISF